jgi:hypothetical protein
MRFMLKAVMDTERGNALAKAGTLGSTIQRILDELKSEAAYFTDDHCNRTAYVFFDMKENSEVPAIAEPWFLALNAHVEFHAVMAPEDLKKAAPGIAKAAKTFG